MTAKKVVHWGRNGGWGFVLERPVYCGRKGKDEAVAIVANRVTCVECKRVRKAELPAIQERMRKRIRIARAKGLPVKGQYL